MIKQESGDHTTQVGQVRGNVNFITRRLIKHPRLLYLVLLFAMLTLCVIIWRMAALLEVKNDYLVFTGKAICGIAEPVPVSLVPRPSSPQTEPLPAPSSGQLKPTATFTLPLEPIQGSSVTWTYKLTGFSGNRWEAWVQFVEGQVPEISWGEFKDEVLIHNPQLVEDDYVFKSNQEYILPQQSE